MPELSSSCLVCSIPCSTQCPSCFSPLCLLDQPIHHLNSICQPWRVSEVAGVGRVLVATRDIQPWELVLEDRALVTAPVNRPVCLGCMGPVDGTVRCDRCGWAVCSQQCAREEQHQVECGIFQMKKSTADVKNFSERHIKYNCVAVLRVLFLKGMKGEDSREWSQIKNLMSHWEERKEMPEVIRAIRIMMEFFVKGLGLDWVQLEDVKHAFGVLDTNALGFTHTEARSLYPVVSMLSHSCDSNLEPITDPGDFIRFRAKRLIKSGEELCMRYVSFLDSGSNIRETLKTKWFFDCGCPRCKDPTEFGSYFSSTKCKCGEGYLVQENFGSNKLICNGCGETKDYSQQIARLNWNFKNFELEQIHAMYKKVKIESGFHKHHHIHFKLGQRLLELGQKTEDLDILGDVVEAGGDVIKTLRMLDKGYTKIMGRCLLLLISCQERLTRLRKKECKLIELDPKEADKTKAMTGAKIQAIKMLSTYVEPLHSVPQKRMILKIAKCSKKYNTLNFFNE